MTQHSLIMKSSVQERREPITPALFFGHLKLNRWNEGFMQQKDDCQRSGRHFARLTVSTLLLAGALTLQPAHAGCSTKSLKGLYGLTTQGINANGIYLTTLSVFDFQPGNGPNGQNQVTEDYFVATANRQTGGTAYGNYQVDSSCHFNLSVIDLTGVRYALEGEVSPNQHKVVVMQTSDSREGVAVGTMQAVGRRSCQPGNFRGDYTFLSDGRIPDNSGQPASWSESLVGRFRATGYGFVQPVELTNTNGVISEAPPAYATANVRHNCLVDLVDSSFIGVLTGRDQQMLYMSRSLGTVRLGNAIKISTGARHESR